MWRSMLAVSVAIAVLSPPARGQANECTSTSVTAARAFESRIKLFARKWRGSPEALAELTKRLRATAQTVWTCSKDNENTCCTIPLAVTPFTGSPTQCMYSVTFPYSELRIKRDGGNFKPKITWHLDPTGSPPPLVFGSQGIEIIPRPLRAPPVNTTGADRCKYDGGGDRFRCKGNGKNKAVADHVANVYVAGKLDDAAYRCENLDPTITNSN